MFEWYKTDLRDRYTGNSVECIYSGDSYDEAWKICEEWNVRNVPDYIPHTPAIDYIGGDTGLIADVYFIDDEDEILGLG